MKFLIALFISITAVASTYVLTDVVTSRTDRSYQPLTEITVENLTLVNADTFERKAYLNAVINGEKRELVANINKRTNTDTTVSYLLTGTFQNNVLAHDVCDEYEAFAYRYNMVINQDKHDNTQALELTKLYVLHSYSYDQCHDRTQVIEFNYSKK